MANFQNTRLCRASVFLMISLVLMSMTMLSVESTTQSQSLRPADASWTATGNLNTARYGHTATLLPNGNVLVAGGAVTFCPYTATNTSELFDPLTGTWSQTGNLNTARDGHSAVLLQNGQVLVAGRHAHQDVTSAELYDPASGTWRLTGNFSTIRTNASLTLLPNGKVLAVGGTGAGLSAELYDAATGTWGSTSAPSTNGFEVLLGNGKVLSVWEGLPWDNYYFALLAELYDPTTGLWSPTGNVNGMYFGSTVTVLRAGRVLVTGDREPHAQLYDYTLGTWSITGSPNTSRVYHTATLQADGRVLVAGGISNGPVGPAELYDPNLGTWSFTSRLIVPRIFHTATLLPNGKTLIVGGRHAALLGDCASTLRSAELYDSGVTNPIDDAQFFVRQHYLDFLNREPDPGGWAYWTNEITRCGSNPLCIHERRIGVSGAFFIENEFQETGYVVYRIHRAAFGVTRLPCIDENGNSCGVLIQQNIAFSRFLTDRAQLSAGPSLPESTIAFANNFVQRPEFLQRYPASMTAAEFVNTLFDTAELTGPENALRRRAAIEALINGSRTRAQVLLDLIEIGEFRTREYNFAFVLMQYFGYLRRDPELGGYNFWLDVLNNLVPGNYRSMMCAFLTSAEYQHRFGSAITRTNADCGS